jgi:ABC-type transport system involved in multi-copper enzyme maturation permease subunit
MDSGRLKRVAAVAENTFRETVRERVLYNLLVFALLMIVTGLIMRDLSVRQDTKIIKDLGLVSMELFGVLIALFIGVGLVSKEIERRSLYPLLAKPLARGEFLVGKFLGLAFTLLVNVSIMTLGLYLTLFAAPVGQDGRLARLDVFLLQAVLGIYLALLLVVAIALFFSVSTSSSALAAVFTLAVVVVGRFADVIRNMREVLPDTPGWLVRGLYYVVPNFHSLDLKSRIVHGQPLAASDLLCLVAYALAYCVVLLAAASAIFRRRDLV